LQLGFPHPDYLLPYLSARQLLEWQTYAGQYGMVRRDDVHWGMLLAMFYNAHRGRGEAKEPADFMVYTPRDEYPDMELEQFRDAIFARLPSR
jgi:hypothetical protein